MGDRCYVSITLHGEFSLEQYHSAVLALDDTGYTHNERAINGLNDWQTAFVNTFITRSGNLYFSQSEVNYGDTSELESVLIECGIAFDIDQGAGDGYSAYRRTYIPTPTGVQDSASEVQTNDGGTVISFDELKNISLLPDDQIAQALKARLDRADPTFPPTTATPELISYLQGLHDLALLQAMPTEVPASL